MSDEEIKKLRWKLRRSRGEVRKILELSPVFHRHVSRSEREAVIYNQCLKLFTDFPREKRREILSRITIVSHSFLHPPAFQF